MIPFLSIVISIVLIAAFLAVLGASMWAAYKLLTIALSILFAMPAHLAIPSPPTPTEAFHERYGRPTALVR